MPASSRLPASPSINTRRTVSGSRLESMTATPSLRELSFVSFNMEYLFVSICPHASGRLCSQQFLRISLFPGQPALLNLDTINRMDSTNKNVQLNQTPAPFLENSGQCRQNNPDLLRSSTLLNESGIRGPVQKWYHHGRTIQITLPVQLSWHRCARPALTGEPRWPALESIEFIDHLESIA